MGDGVYGFRLLPGASVSWAIWEPGLAVRAYPDQVGTAFIRLMTGPRPAGYGPCDHEYVMEPPGKTSPDTVSRFLSERIVDAWKISGHAELQRLARIAEAKLPPSGVLASADEAFELAQRAAWVLYLEAAEAIGMFKGRHGNNLRLALAPKLDRALTLEEVHHFRAAMSECRAAWWLLRVMDFPLSPQPTGAGGKVLEMSIDTVPPIGVEVKSPFRQMRHPGGGAWVADPDQIDHIGAVMLALKDAELKFDPALQNLTILDAHLDWPVEAAVLRGFETGHLEKTSAVMLIHTLPDSFNEDDGCTASVTHSCTVLRNRLAARQIDSDLWDEWPELVGPECSPWSKLTRMSGRNKPYVQAGGVWLPRHAVVPC
jgi:hypothetical protein